MGARNNKVRETDGNVSVGIIGCGWLGQALVPALQRQNYSVVATTQTPEKLTIIEHLGATAELLSLPIEQREKPASVFNCSTLVICITPQIRQGKIDYPEKIAQIVASAEHGQVEKLIQLSSTAVYDGHLGLVTEETPLNLDIDKVAILAKAEQNVLNFNGASVVLRLAGLVGEDRHPAKFFSSGRMLKSPNSHVNLIHQDDVVALILAFIANDKHQGVFNAVSEMDVTKKQFYSIAAQATKQLVPIFEQENDDDIGKIVSGKKLVESLNYQYLQNDLIRWLTKETLID